MQPLTPQQEESLVSYSAQRDQIIGELSAKYKENETLGNTNKDLTESNSQLVAEIATNTQKVKETQSAADGIVEQTQTQIKEAKSNLETLNAKKVEVEASTAKELENLSVLTEAIKVALLSLKELNVEIVETKKEVNDSAETIISSSNEVRRAVAEMQNITTEFYNKNVAQETDNLNSKNQLDKRQERLDAREAALNVTYSEVVADMDKKGIKLSDLNKAA